MCHAPPKVKRCSVWDLPDPRQPNSLLSQRSLAPPHSVPPVSVLLPTGCRRAPYMWGWAQEVLHQAPCSWDSCVLTGSEGSRGALSRNHLAGTQLPVCTVGLSGLHHTPRRHLLPTKRPSWSSPQALMYPAVTPTALSAATLSYLQAPGHSHSPNAVEGTIVAPKGVLALTPETVCYLTW